MYISNLITQILVSVNNLTFQVQNHLQISSNNT
nr:MAG TPA: hypothetical protein [Bacteriophage sp.]